MSWTTARDLQDQVLRLWNRGIVLQTLILGGQHFPRRLILKAPASQDLAHAFMDVRTWSDELARVSKIRFVQREVRHRVSGVNAYPCEAWIDSARDAVELLGKGREWCRFGAIVDATRQRRPEILAWLARKPFVALDAGDDWGRFLDLVDWLAMHPRPGCYLRQVDLPGIDTKFIEANRGVLAELFDMALPSTSIDDTDHAGVAGFCERYGFRAKPERLRLRVLDPVVDPLGLGSVADIAIDLDTAAALECIPENLFVTENETNFLAFPRIPRSWILFGAGYGFSGLRRVPWIERCRIIYWGDVDTHGFAVLDEIRGIFPSVESILMDRDTLLHHRTAWGTEPSPCTRTLSHLTIDEATLFADLQSHRLAPNLRLEQERISFASLFSALRVKGFTPS